MTPLERMKADAKICNSKLKTNSKVIHTPEPTKSRGASKTRGDGWRNGRLTDDEIGDIKYFLSKGWEILIILEGLYSYERSPQFRKIKLAGDKRLKTYRSAKQVLEGVLKIEPVKL